jgi:hypothetical protein
MACHGGKSTAGQPFNHDPFACHPHGENISVSEWRSPPPTPRARAGPGTIHTHKQHPPKRSCYTNPHPARNISTASRPTGHANYSRRQRRRPYAERHRSSPSPPLCEQQDAMHGCGNRQRPGAGAPPPATGRWAAGQSACIAGQSACTAGQSACTAGQSACMLTRCCQLHPRWHQRLPTGAPTGALHPGW